MQHNHNLPSYVAFVNLVKAFNTVNHKMMLQRLERYGAPPKLWSAISRMYKNLKIVLKIGKVEEKWVRRWACCKETAWNWCCFSLWSWPSPRPYKKIELRPG